MLLNMQYLQKMDKILISYFKKLWTKFVIKMKKLRQMIVNFIFLESKINNNKSQIKNK